MDMHDSPRFRISFVLHPHTKPQQRDDLLELLSNRPNCVHVAFLDDDQCSVGWRIGHVSGRCGDAEQVLALLRAQESVESANFETIRRIP